MDKKEKKNLILDKKEKDGLLYLDIFNPISGTSDEKIFTSEEEMKKYLFTLGAIFDRI